jgi:hypothetical protein
MMRQLLRHSAATCMALERPVISNFYWLMFGAILGKPSIPQTTSFIHISPKAKESIDAWSHPLLQCRGIQGV